MIVTSTGHNSSTTTEIATYCASDIAINAPTLAAVVAVSVGLFFLLSLVVVVVLVAVVIVVVAAAKLLQATIPRLGSPRL